MKPFLVALLAVALCKEYTAFPRSQLSSSSFYEPFDYPNLELSPWIVSHVKKDDLFAYRGQWSIETSSAYPGFEDDKGLVMKTPAAHHAISYKFDTPIDNTDKTLVVQYEIKTQDDLSCGGTYLKLLDELFEPALFSGDTNYHIMFGPDRCGSENKIHFIINHKDVKTGVFEQKHLRTPPMSRTGQFTNLYTLIFRPDLDFEIRINGEVAKAGNLVSNPHLLTPPLNPPKEIVDVNDHKPLDWDDEKFIPDPNSEAKPEGYDETYGRSYIPDPKAVKPSDWDESKPATVPDPQAARPDYWDDEEDGIWIAPEVANPECEHLSGCGPWKAPLIPNKNYKGPWIRPTIPNPKYRGEWKPRNIPNPDYYEDKTPSNIGPIGGLGFELWTMNKDVLFDNIYVGHSVQDAEKLGNETYVAKHLLEWEGYEQHKPKARVEPLKPPTSFDDILEEESTLTAFFEFIPLVLLRQYLDISDFYYEFSLDPLHTIVGQPIKFLVYCCAFVTIFTFVFGTISAIAYTVSAPPKVQQKVEEPEIETKEATSTTTGTTTGAKGTKTRARRRG